MNEHTVVELIKLLDDTRKFQEEDCECGTCGKCTLSSKIYLMGRRLRHEAKVLKKNIVYGDYGRLEKKILKIFTEGD